MAHKEQIVVADKFEQRKRTLDLEYAFFERQIAIDKYKLDECLTEHPGLYAKVCERYAEVLSLHDGLKEREKIKSAGAAVNLRRKYEDQSIKFTEGSIKAEVELDYDRRDAMKRFLWGVQELARWEGLKEGFRDRGYALRELATLFVANYYSSSTAHGSIRATQDKTLDENRKKIAEKRKQREKEREARELNGIASEYKARHD